MINNKKKSSNFWLKGTLDNHNNNFKKANAWIPLDWYFFRFSQLLYLKSLIRYDPLDYQDPAAKMI